LPVTSKEDEGDFFTVFASLAWGVTVVSIEGCDSSAPVLEQPLKASITDKVAVQIAAIRPQSANSVNFIVTPKLVTSVDVGTSLDGR
jgi:hypothetical protein